MRPKKKQVRAFRKLVKVRFPLRPGEWKELKAENLWAKPQTSGEFLVRSVPFYVYGISFGDTVHASPSRGILRFAGVARRGGHSTYRMLLSEDDTIESQRFLKYWNPLETLGCTFELAKHRWVAVDVPPDIDINKIYSLLEKGEAGGAWSFEEGHCGHTINS
ncbi:MAG: DUF4265 domain-containing protein [Acidobacteria bacterium]|nr:DUF4265 domain-containing protein [Acidobacteriota bacterium]